MNNYLPTDYQAFIHTSRYARWVEEEGRRETWAETVDRYMTNVVGDKVKPKIRNEIEEAILNLDVMPSMRSLMTAGEALDRDNTAGYNCSYTPIDHPRCFDEVLYILLNGTGVGFSVEEQFVNKLQGIPHTLYESGNIIGVADSKEGWANAYRQLIEQLFEGKIPKFNVSRVRPAGSQTEDIRWTCVWTTTTCGSVRSYHRDFPSGCRKKPNASRGPQYHDQDWRGSCGWWGPKVSHDQPIRSR